MTDLDSSIFADVIFALEGAVALTWEVGTRCACYTTDTQQPLWGCPTCSGFGVSYAAPVAVTGLFRSQSRWVNVRREGEIAHGDAQLTTPLAVKPGYTDHRVRDRFTVTQASGDAAAGRVFYPAQQPVPFIFNGVQYAWRTSLQALEQQDRVKAQP